MMQQELAPEAVKENIVALIDELTKKNAEGPWYFPPALTVEARSRRALDTSTGEVQLPKPPSTQGALASRDTLEATPSSENPRSSQPERHRGTLRLELPKEIQTLDTVPIDELSGQVRAQIGALPTHQVGHGSNGGTPFMGQTPRAVPAAQQAQRTTAPMRRQDAQRQDEMGISSTHLQPSPPNRPQTAPLTVRVATVGTQVSQSTLSAPPSAKRRTRLGLWITIVVLTICATLGALAAARYAGLLGQTLVVRGVTEVC